MNTTYTKHDDYYVFDDQPFTRIYLGDKSIEDYIWDQEQQAMRSASAWYKEIHTGKDVTWDEIMDYNYDGSKPGNGCVWYGSPDHEFDKRENHTFEGGHTHDFERKLSMASVGSTTSGARSSHYIQGDKAIARLAWAYAFNQTLEEYDEMQKESEARLAEFDTKYPLLKDLVWANGEMYYQDKDGNRKELAEGIEERSKEI